MNERVSLEGWCVVRDHQHHGEARPRWRVHTSGEIQLAELGRINEPSQRASEKGIDVAIAVDMIRLGMSGYMDATILFSSDNDLMPAVEVLWTMPQCHVEVASWSGAHRIRLPGTQQPWCHHLNENDFRAARDTYDYSTHE